MRISCSLELICRRDVRFAATLKFLNEIIMDVVIQMLDVLFVMAL